MFDYIIKLFTELTPVDLSVTMSVFTIVDIWLGLRLALKNKTMVSKALLKGFLYNMFVVLLPFCLAALAHLQPFQTMTTKDVDYIQLLSIVVTVMYICASMTSILANYAALSPDSYNFLTNFANKYFPAEIESKLKKHSDSTQTRPVDLPKPVVSPQSEAEK